MSLLKKIIKGILIIIIILIIFLAGYAALLYFHIIKAPAFMPDLPYINDKQLTSANKKLSEVEKMAQENDILKKQLNDKEKEIDLLKQDFQELEDKQQAYKQADDKYQEKIIELNNQLNESAQNASDQDSIYKDMARYFMEMNSKDAADLMTRLEEKDTIGILEKMEVDSAAEVLQKMPRDKAASITRKMLVSSPQ